jgi:tetratricopeptide (TPR) repeat protein
MKQEFSRGEVRRMLRVSEKQLKAWERQQFLEPSETYGVADLVALRSLIQLKKNNVQAAQIRRALAALSRKLQNVSNPLTQLKIYADGKKVRVDLDGGTMDAESGQLLLDFGARAINRLLEFRAKKDDAQKEQSRRAEAEQWFERGLDLEQKGAPISEVIAAYEKAIELDPNSAGALVNLGTIYFNARSWTQAERHYKRAIDADPQYSLAHFDLANLYDERGDRKKALDHYLTALQLAPSYADAHYNIALLYQGMNQPMKAVRHWTTYLKLDPASHWATIARRELQKLRQSTIVEGAREEHGTA